MKHPIVSTGWYTQDSINSVLQYFCSKMNYNHISVLMLIYAHWYILLFYYKTVYDGKFVVTCYSQKLLFF